MGPQRGLGVNTGGGKRVLIVGAGLAGSLLAIYLVRAGWRVIMHERRSDPRVKGYVGGRSINLALSVRGIDALKGVGLDQLILGQDAIAMRGRMIHAAKPDTAACWTTFQPYSTNANDAINSVSRGGLNLTLLNEAAKERNVELVFDSMCVDVDLNAPAAMFKSASGGERRVEADLIASADGAFSAVRGVMMKTDRFDYSQTYLTHGYKELHIPAATDLPGAAAREWLTSAATSAVNAHHAPDASVSRSLFVLEPHALHIWPRGGAMMIALPNRDGSFTCTLFWPFEGEHGLHTARDAGQVRAHFAKHYADATALMPTLVDDFMHNPSSSLVTVRSWPWQHGGKVVLLGDAAHAIVPFFGQGMNAAFEDVKSLAMCLGESRGDQRGALERFQVERKPHADAIAEMALTNFIEMRDLVAREEFRYHKRVEQVVHAARPNEVTPLYNLVSFTTVPYAESLRRGTLLKGQIERVIARVPASEAAGMSDALWRERVLREFDAIQR